MPLTRRPGRVEASRRNSTDATCSSVSTCPVPSCHRLAGNRNNSAWVSDSRGLQLTGHDKNVSVGMNRESASILRTVGVPQPYAMTRQDACRKLLDLFDEKHIHRLANTIVVTDVAMNKHVPPLHGPNARSSTSVGLDPKIFTDPRAVPDESVR